MAAAEVAKLKSVRSVAKSYGICHVTLHRYVREKRKLEAAGITDTLSIIVGYSRHRQVFNAATLKLRQYLKAASAMYYGLSERPAAVPSTSARGFNPVAVRPLPKAEATKVSTKGTKRKVTTILTDTPVKVALKQEAGDW
ncbi:hypothetical protein AAFF_G00115910 [Aldrovandia affinis]|uniref:HTH psq-type domain-containing protein n=1 Tax=Aldrovandia affinis TaxID=143900 RepID=A0AAD7T1E8_9TELE|nr:hypothetical protein AAFF_G00115910 [Aldrovandia affinis]